MNIKRKIRVNKIKSEINKRICNILCFIFKPLAILDKRIRQRKINKIKERAKNLTNEEAVSMTIKYIISYLTKHPNDSIEFDYVYEYDENNILTYMKNSKNDILRKWYYDLSFNEEQETISELMEILKYKLKSYSEIQCHDYQAHQWSHKILVIKLKEYK